MELKLYARGQFKSDEQLWKAIQLVVRSADKMVANELYNKMPSRLLKVVECKSGKIE